jgi:hypothetical protein
MNRPGLFVFLKSRGLHLGFPASGWKLKGAASRSGLVTNAVASRSECRHSPAPKVGHFKSPPKCASSLTECQQTQQKVKARAMNASIPNAASNPFGPAIRVAAVMGADNSTRQTVSIFLPFIWEKTLVMGLKRGVR